MKKMTLDMEALRVETFHPAPHLVSRGTVVGQQEEPTRDPGGSASSGEERCTDARRASCACSAGETCPRTCAETCGETCADTCEVTCVHTCHGFECATDRAPGCEFSRIVCP